MHKSLLSQKQAEIDILRSESERYRTMAMLASDEAEDEARRAAYWRRRAEVLSFFQPPWVRAMRRLFA